jgi:hypothetical protein
MLKKEVIYFHELVFQTKPNVHIIEQYEKVHQCYSASFTLKDQHWIDHLIDKKVNIIPLEFFLRVMRKNASLSQKLQVLTYLTECDSEYAKVYYNPNTTAFPFIAIIILAIKTVYFFFYGALLSVLYGPK